VFLVRQLAPDDQSPETLAIAVSDAIWPVHVAFLLDRKIPLMATPTLSSSYVVLPVLPDSADIVSRSTLRFIGPLEREFIVYGSPLTYRYDAEDLVAVDGRCSFLVTNDVRNRGGDVLAAIDVLEETARPDSWYVEDLKTDYLHGFVRCMAACESLLLSADDGGKGDSITETFGRHAAALLRPLLRNREEGAKYFSSLYQLRSQLIHGRAVPDQQDQSVLSQLHGGRRLLRDVVCAALTVQVAMPDGFPLNHILSDAWADPDKQLALADVVAPGLRS
jgi:hypothetical protein